MVDYTEFCEIMQVGARVGNWREIAGWFCLHKNVALLQYSGVFFVVLERCTLP